MTDKSEPARRFSRREMLAITGVGSLVAIGCEVVAEEGPDPRFRSRDSVPPVDTGYRLYPLPSREDPYFQLTRDDLPSPICIYLGFSDPHADSSCFLWGTKTQIKAVEFKRRFADEAAKPLREKAPKDVAEYGSADEANGIVNVMFAPNIREQWPARKQSEKKQEAEKRNYATTAQIAARWKKQFGDKIEVELVKQSPPPKSGIGQLNMPGQIKLQFKGQLPAEVLKAIKQHPQSVRIQWGKEPFTSLYCPPCGMG